MTVLILQPDLSTAYCTLICMKRFLNLAILPDAGVPHTISPARVCQIDKMCSNFYSKFLIWWPIELRTLGNFSFWSKNMCWPPSRGVSPPKVEIQSSRNYMLWVLWTCFSRRLAQCKRNQLNPTTLPGENVQNVVQFCCFGPMSKYPNICVCFGRFLLVGWSN